MCEEGKPCGDDALTDEQQAKLAVFEKEIGGKVIKAPSRQEVIEGLVKAFNVRIEGLKLKKDSAKTQERAIEFMLGAHMGIQLASGGALGLPGSLLELLAVGVPLEALVKGKAEVSLTQAQADAVKEIASRTKATILLEEIPA